MLVSARSSQEPLRNVLQASRLPERGTQAGRLHHNGELAQPIFARRLRFFPKNIFARGEHLRIAGRSRLLQNHVLMRPGVVGGGSVPRSLGRGYAALGRAKKQIEQFLSCGIAALGCHLSGQPRAAVPHSFGPRLGGAPALNDSTPWRRRTGALRGAALPR